MRGCWTPPINSPHGWPDGDPEPFHIEENESTFTIDWKGSYRIEGAAFVYMVEKPAGSPPFTDTDAQTNSDEMMLKISNIFG
jgi:hypothetical protein